MKLNRHDSSWKYLWKNSRYAPKREKWKWDYLTWLPVLEKIWQGDTSQLVCPICHQKSVYFKHLAVYETEVSGQLQLHGERWVGCTDCQVQYHDRAKVPAWLKNPEWEPAAEKWRRKRTLVPVPAL